MSFVNPTLPAEGIGMWIGNFSARYLPSFSLFLLFACTSENESTVDFEEPRVAWWYDTEFQSQSDVIHGIDVKAIDESWRHAHGLEPNDLEDQVSQNAAVQFMASPLSFGLSADLDEDGDLEEFFVGVFEVSDSERGRFVLITKNGELVQHFVERGSAGFSALLASEGKIRWYKCMECGEFESITWTGHSYALE